MTASTPLANGKEVLVDDADLALLSQYKWHMTANGYATRNISHRNPDTLPTYMHRLLLNPPTGMDCDHINGNRLDNRRSNLRIVTRQENLWNSRRNRDNSSQYKGVHYSKAAGRWVARFVISGKENYIGLFNTPEDAARAYDAEIVKHRGIYAKLNFPTQP